MTNVGLGGIPAGWSAPAIWYVDNYGGEHWGTRTMLFAGRISKIVYGIQTAIETFMSGEITERQSWKLSERYDWWMMVDQNLFRDGVSFIRTTNWATGTLEPTFSAEDYIVGNQYADILPGEIRDPSLIVDGTLGS